MVPVDIRPAMAGMAKGDAVPFCRVRLVVVNVMNVIGRMLAADDAGIFVSPSDSALEGPREGGRILGLENAAAPEVGPRTGSAFLATETPSMVARIDHDDFPAVLAGALDLSALPQMGLGSSNRFAVPGIGAHTRTVSGPARQRWVEAIRLSAAMTDQLDFPAPGLRCPAPTGGGAVFGASRAVLEDKECLAAPMANRLDLGLPFVVSRTARRHLITSMEQPHPEERSCRSRAAEWGCMKHETLFPHSASTKQVYHRTGE